LWPAGDPLQYPENFTSFPSPLTSENPPKISSSAGGMSADFTMRLKAL